MQIYIPSNQTDRETPPKTRKRLRNQRKGSPRDTDCNATVNSNLETTKKRCLAQDCQTFSSSNASNFPYSKQEPLQLTANVSAKSLSYDLKLSPLWYLLRTCKRTLVFAVRLRQRRYQLKVYNLQAQNTRINSSTTKHIPVIIAQRRLQLSMGNTRREGVSPGKSVAQS